MGRRNALILVALFVAAALALLFVACQTAPTPDEPAGASRGDIGVMDASIAFSTSNDAAPPGDWFDTFINKSGSVTLDEGIFTEGTGSYKHASGTEGYTFATSRELIILTEGGVYTATFKFRYTGDLENCLVNQRSAGIGALGQMKIKCDPFGDGDAGALVEFNDLGEIVQQSDIELQPSTWYSITIESEASSVDERFFRIWVNGSLELEITDADPISELYICSGSYFWTGLEYYRAILGGDGYTVWIDDVTLEVEPGEECLEPTSTPTATAIALDAYFTEILSTTGNTPTPRPTRTPTPTATP